MMKVKNFTQIIRSYSRHNNKKLFKVIKYPKVHNESKSTCEEYQETRFNPGIDYRLRLYQDDEIAAKMSASHEFSDLADDTDEYDYDFMQAGQAYREHESELKARKEKLKNMITYKKYFEEVEPSFLTFAEKEKIKYLHKQDPNQWSVDRLSESFPAPPNIIKKVLRAKWKPKSVEAVLRYDRNVASNWENFKKGDLPVSEETKKHLMKFKNRQLPVIEDEELAKQFVAPKLKFPEPNTKFFINIAKTCLLSNLETKTITYDDNPRIESTGNEKNNSDLNDEIYEEYKNEKVEKSLVWKNSRLSKENSERITFDEFLAKNVSSMDDSQDPETIVMRETYRKKIDGTMNSEGKVSSSTLDNKEDNLDKLTNVRKNNPPALLEQTVNELVDEDSQSKLNIDRSGVETYVKIWHKKADLIDNYSDIIKIPKRRFKKGMTYRVKDCFYDDDGQFLYRVPGLYD